MNDFLQLQPENMTYAWVSVVIAIIGLLVAIFFYSVHSRVQTKRIA